MSSGQPHTAISSEFARLLREVRRKRGLSLNVLAQRSGLARQTISYIEKEKQSPSLDTSLRITAVLGIKLERLLAEARKRAEGKAKG